MKIAIQFIIILAASVLLSSCGDSENSAEDLKFGALSGTYQVGDDCIVNAKGARASVEDCALEEFVRWPVNVSGNATLGEEKITFQGGGDEYWEEYGCLRSVCNVQVSGSFEKRSGRQSSGPFEAFAGEWDGQVDIEHVCTKIEVIDPTDESCYWGTDTEFGAEYLDETRTWQESIPLQASVSGSRIEVSGESTFEILIDDDTLIIDGTRFDRN